MDTRETRGANLKSHIKSKAMSQREAAAKIGISAPHLANILNGKENMGFIVVNKIVAAFPEVSARYLLTGEGALLGGRNIYVQQNVDRSPGSTISQGDAALVAEVDRLKAENEWLRGLVEKLSSK